MSLVLLCVCLKWHSFRDIYFCSLSFISLTLPLRKYVATQKREELQWTKYYSDDFSCQSCWIILGKYFAITIIVSPNKHVNNLTNNHKIHNLITKISFWFKRGKGIHEERNTYYIFLLLFVWAYGEGKKDNHHILPLYNHHHHWQEESSFNHHQFTLSDIVISPLVAIIPILPSCSDIIFE